VFIISALAPSLAIASTASMKPRWLRARIATPSPARTPARASALARRFVRLCTCANVSVPASSITIGSSG